MPSFVQNKRSLSYLMRKSAKKAKKNQIVLFAKYRAKQTKFEILYARKCQKCLMCESVKNVYKSVKSQLRT